MKYVVLGMVVLIALLTAPHIYRNWHTDREIQGKIDRSVDQLGTDRGGANRAGHVEVEGALWRFTEEKLHEIVHQEIRTPGRIYFWNWGGVRRATASALGLDRQHHFANSYLVGYQPFETKQLWVPLYTLAMRKHYEYDHLQYSGLQEVWQNSKQAYFFTRGDCEDHAIILADWLIEMGIDARVVMGNHKEEGHAWVVFFLNSQAYLLEATSKRKTRSIGDIPAASLKVEYHPMYQFNRDSFWANRGSRFTTQYAGPQWQITSRFVAAKGRRF